MTDINELIKLEPYKSCYEYGELVGIEQGRADAIDEAIEAFNEHLFDSPMMNPIMTRNEILLFLDHLKEQTND